MASNLSWLLLVAQNICRPDPALHRMVTLKKGELSPIGSRKLFHAAGGKYTHAVTFHE